MNALRMIAVVLSGLLLLAACDTAADKHGDDVTFVGVAAQSDVAAMRAFATRNGIDSFTNLNDKDGSVWATFDVPAQPAFAFISASGDVERVNGTVTEQELERWIATRAQA